MEQEFNEAKKTWIEIMDFYDKFIESTDSNPAWDYIPRFREIVLPQIVESKYSRHLFASQSHSTLVVTVVRDYPERLDHPIVHITPLRNLIAVEAGKSIREMNRYVKFAPSNDGLANKNWVTVEVGKATPKSDRYMKFESLYEGILDRLSPIFEGLIQYQEAQRK